MTEVKVAPGAVLAGKVEIDVSVVVYVKLLADWVNVTS